MHVFEQVRQISSVISVPGQLPALWEFLTHTGCGCNTVSLSGTVIDCRVFKCQAADLHVGCAGWFVYSQCGLALKLLSISSVTCRTNPSNPLQFLSRPLLHPVHIVVSEFVARSFARQFHWGPRLLQLSPRLLQLDLWVDCCGKKGKVNIIVIRVHVWTSRLELGSPLPVDAANRKRIIQLWIMMMSRVFSDCRKNTDYISL